MTLRAGVIGLGVGEAHIAGYAAHPGTEVVAVSDIDPARLEEVGARHPGLRLEPDPDALLDDPGIDVVSVASYDDAHFAQVSRALRNGKHVFVEKPLCLAPDEARALHELRAAHPRLRMSSNLPLRLSPRFLALRDALAAGRLGRIFYAEADYEYGRLWKLTEGWRGRLPYYSVVLGGAVHVVDLLLWLTGERVVRVTAHGNRIATEGTQFRFDDFVIAVLECASGTILKVTANFACVQPHFHALKLFGTEGTFVNGREAGTLWLGRDDDPRAETIDAPYPGVLKGDLIASFVEAILTGGDAVVTEDDVFATMDVLFAIEQAAGSGAPVELVSGSE
jgi:predicted dehydrogenase